MTIIKTADEVAAERAELVDEACRVVGEYREGRDNLEQAKELFAIARKALREHLRLCVKVVGKGRAFDLFKRELREAMVAKGICENVKSAGRLIRNCLIAEGLTGLGQHGVRPTDSEEDSGNDGAGRPTKATMGEIKISSKDVGARMTALLAYVALEMRAFPADDNVQRIGSNCALIASGNEPENAPSAPKRAKRNAAGFAVDHKEPDSKGDK